MRPRANLIWINDLRPSSPILRQNANNAEVLLMPRDAYQTVKEVADRLKVNEVTVRQWIRDGHLGRSTSARAGVSPTAISKRSSRPIATRPRAPEGASASANAGDGRA
jgi:transposase-like protein